MNKNPSFVFFRPLDGEDRWEPRVVALTPGRVWRSIGRSSPMACRSGSTPGPARRCGASPAADGGAGYRRRYPRPRAR